MKTQRKNWWLVMAGLVLVSAQPAGAADAGWTNEWDRLLGAYVQPTGVRYAAWQANARDRASLIAITEQVAAMDLAPLSRDEKLAALMNAYNAWMIRLVLESYPIASVQQIAPDFGVFRQPRIRVAGQTTSLDMLEKQAILLEFREPRAHFVVNCAAKSCPALAPFAMRGARLEEQLTERTRAAADTAYGVLIDHRNAELRLSRIFEWYAADFAPAGGAFAFLQKYRSKPLPDNYTLGWQDYNWALNEVP